MKEKLLRATRSAREWTRKNVPPVARAFFVFAFAGAVIHILSCFLPSVADFFNTTICHTARSALAFVSSILPFSIAETLLLLLPVWIALIVYGILHRRRDSARLRRYIAFLLSVVALFYGLFAFTIGCGYHAPTLESKMGLASAPVTVDDLYDTAVWLRAEANRLSADVSMADGENSVMPYTFAELNEKMRVAYGIAAVKYDFLPYIYSSAKPVPTVGETMTYMHITGVYSYMTGEANVNPTFPDYLLPFTVAHEMAHQRGICRENEANFAAFLVCDVSDDPYIRYSGYMQMLEYVTSALAGADRARFNEVWRGYTHAVQNEMRAYNAFYERYDGTEIGEISHAVNDAYLHAQGTEGVKSYGMVVDLCVAYYRARAEV